MLCKVGYDASCQEATAFRKSLYPVDVSEETYFPLSKTEAKVKVSGIDLLIW